MPNNRKKVPKDHPLQTTFRETDVRRAREDLDDIFDFPSNNLERNDVKATKGSKGAAKIEPSGYLDDEEFETFTEQAKSSPKLGWDAMDKSNYAKPNKLDTPKPLDVHLGRGQEAAQQDTKREAPVTTDPAKYASNPDQLDYPFVDTTADFKDKWGDESNAFAKLDEKAGPDNIFQL